MKKEIKKSIQKVDITIGELVEAVSNIAAEHAKSEQEQYLLTTQAVEEILNQQRQ